MPPKILLHYELLDKIGEGGMGEVYRARDTRLSRHVAVKLLPAEVTEDPERVLRFRQEARAASALNHPHIVAVFDTGQVDSTHFIVMELIDGRRPTVWVAQEKPDLGRVLEFITQVADALAAAHEAGLIHRDVKPANLLISPQGYAKVLDFGLAKLTEDSPSADATQTQSMTKPGVVIGTLAYMSPEQAQGRPLDARTDIFSLGAVLYELVTGRRPHDGSTPIDLMHSIVHSNPRSAREAAPSTPPELEWILDKALAKDLRERYQTMSEFAADLRKLRRRLASGGVRPEILPARRRREWLYAAGGAMAAAAIVALWFTSLKREPVKPSAPIQRAETTITQLTSYTGTEHSGAISPDGRYFA